MKTLKTVWVLLFLANLNLAAQTLVVPPQNGSNEGGEISLQGASSFNDWKIDNYSGALRFHHSGQTHFWMRPDGSIVDLQTNRLDVTSSSGSSNAALHSVNDQNVRSLFYTGRSGNSAISGKMILENTSQNEILLNPSGGNVGIGTTSPQERLDFVGSIQSDYLGVNAVNSAEGGEIRLDGPAGYNDWKIDNRYGQFRLHHSGSNHLTVHPNGQVGIGTVSAPLGSHKLAVEGSIGAREIKVEVGSWSDFVFDNDYELRSLEEVAQHIKEKGHLPEIPNETEALTEGINLGEMNAKLLQKIEELTLYLINQNEEIKQLKNKVKQLEKQ